MSRMFPFITCTWNPIGGKCPYNCVYCWSQSEKGLVNRYDMKKYRGKIRIISKELNKKFNDDDFVFIQDMSDLYAENVPNMFITLIHMKIATFPNTRFLALTKNPAKYLEFTRLPHNLILGATIESNRFFDYSKAPSALNRLYNMIQVRKKFPFHSTFISIEPILIFTTCFIEGIKRCHPNAIAVGYDNYNHKLKEPTEYNTLNLISELEPYMTVYRKTIRKAWNERQD